MEAKVNFPKEHILNQKHEIKLLVEVFPPLSHEVHPADGAGCGHLPLSAAAIAPEETRIWEKENGRTRTDGRMLDILL